MVSSVVYGQEERLLPWAQKRIGLTFRRDAYTIGLDRDGEIAAVVVYDNFSQCDVNMHIASDGTKAWLNKELLLRAFFYPFVQLDLARVTGLVPADNGDALRFDENLGFVREGYHPCAMPGGKDLISLGLLKEKCRFLPKDVNNV